MKKFLTPILFITLFSSCYINKNYQAKAGLKYSGTYTVQSVQGRNVTFKEMPGITYTVDSDNLKKDQKITINVIRAHGGNQANIITSNPNLVKN